MDKPTGGIRAPLAPPRLYSFINNRTALPIRATMSSQIAAPAAVKFVQPFLTRADELKTANPIVSYYCKCFGHEPPACRDYVRKEITIT